MNDIVSELGIDRSKLSMVKVTNQNGFVMKDRFDGTPFVFRPNQPLIIPPLAAMHFFNWPGDPEEMKAHTTRRFGWNRPDHVGADKNRPFEDDMFGDGKTVADRYWENLRIEPVHYNIVPADDPSMPEAEPEQSTTRVDVVLPPTDDLTHGGAGRKGRKLDL